MSSGLTVKRATIIVVGVSAIGCVSAALHYWFKKRQSRQRDIDQQRIDGEIIKKSVRERQEEKNEKIRTEIDDVDDLAIATTLQKKTNTTTNGEYRTDAPAKPTILDVNFDEKKKTVDDSTEKIDNNMATMYACVTPRNTICSSSADGEVSSVLQQNGGDLYRNSVPSPSLKGQCIESPSLGSDLHSEGSQDSGKGTSIGLTSSMSPVEELIEIPPMYEFEVPQDIVGLLIGKQGQTIKWLTLQSQAHIVIRQHFASDKHKICTLEGTRDQINKCLRLIRRKFPPSRFPELKLTPILPPPITSTHTPVWDNVIQLNLPEGVNCEVVVSSIVNVGHFFLQQPTHPTFSSLSRLDQYMLAVYSQPAGVPPLPRPIEMGVICAAPVLGGWYRAQTMDIYDDTDEVLVKYVDYGGYSRVSASDLRQIRSDFMTLPFQATECYLSNVKPTDEKEGWSQEAFALFEQLSQGKVIEASVTGHASDNIPLVELFGPTQDSKNAMVNRLLVQSGLAVWTD